jgi:hypothetical protein
MQENSTYRVRNNQVMAVSGNHDAVATHDNVRLAIRRTGTPLDWLVTGDFYRRLLSEWEWSRISKLCIHLPPINRLIF